jgi:hypothetical protein
MMPAQAHVTTAIAAAPPKIVTREMTFMLRWKICGIRNA